MERITLQVTEPELQEIYNGLVDLDPARCDNKEAYVSICTVVRDVIAWRKKLTKERGTNV